MVGCRADGPGDAVIVRHAPEEHFSGVGRGAVALSHPRRNGAPVGGWRHDPSATGWTVT